MHSSPTKCSTSWLTELSTLSQTRQERLKSVPHLRLQNRKVFKSCFKLFFKKPNTKESKQPKGAFRARETLQKFQCSVVGHMGALFFQTSASFLVKRKLVRI